MKQKVICLADCDSFFVACEQINHPELRGKPVCVLTGSGDRGIVVSRSKEAKALGIRMGEPLFQVKERRIEACFLPARHEFYQEISTSVMNVLRGFSPDVEQVSVDEAFVDLTGLSKLYKQDYVSLATTIRQQILEQTQLPVSIGLAPTKTLAKLASDKAKGNGGLFVISPENISTLIGDIPIDDVCGIGKQNSQRMHFSGIFNIRDFTCLDDAFIRRNFGISGLNIKYELLGICISTVDNRPHRPKSVQDTAVLSCFTQDFSLLRSALNAHIHHACRRLRHQNGFCKSIGVMLRHKNFHVTFEKCRLPFYTNSEADIMPTAAALLQQMFDPRAIYRSTGISLEEISYDAEIQPSLFAESPLQHDSNLSRALDELETKFGKDIVKTGWL